MHTQRNRVKETKTGWKFKWKDRVSSHKNVIMAQTLYTENEHKLN